MDNELLNQVLSILLPALATLIAGWFAVLGQQIKAKYDEKINTQIKKDIVNETVNYVQQIYYSLDGDARLQKAIEQASLILRDKGISVSEVELRTLIESAVYGLNKGFYESERKAIAKAEVVKEKGEEEK